MFKLIFPLALLAAPALATADGYEASAKDTGYVYSYSVKQSRGGWECPREFSRKECSKLRQVIATRRAREDRPRKIVVERRAPVIRDTIIRPARAEFGGRGSVEGMARHGSGDRRRRTVYGRPIRYRRADSLPHLRRERCV